MLFILAYPEFAPPTRRAIDRFRLLHEPERAKLVRPHITLVFGLRHAQVADILSLCRKVALLTKGFEVSFGKSEIVYDPFDRKSKLVLNCAAGKGALSDLHKRLYDGPHRGELVAGTPYSPHMTIATNADRFRLEQLELSDFGALPIQSMVRSLNVVDLSPTGLRHVQSIPLSG